MGWYDNAAEQLVPLGGVSGYRRIPSRAINER